MAANNAFGLPVIAPVLVLKVNPTDDKLTVPVIAYDNVPYPPLPVTGVKEYDCEFLVKVTVGCNNVEFSAGIVVLKSNSLSSGQQGKAEYCSLILILKIQARMPKT